MEGIYHFFLDGATWIDCTLLLREVFWCLFVTCRHFSFTHVRFLPGRSNSLRDVKCLAPFSIHKDIKNLLSEIKWYQFMPLLTGRNVKCLLSKNKIHNENVVHIWSFWNVKCQLLPGRDENICKGEKCEMWNVYSYMCSFQKWMKIICSACWSFWNLNCWMKISENAVKWLLITCYVKCLLVNKCTPSRKEWKYLHCLLIILICEMSIGKCTPSRKEWKYLHCLLIIIICEMSIGKCTPSRKEWKYLHCLLIILICEMSIGKCTPSRKEWKYLHCLLIIIICEMSIGKCPPSRKEWKYLHCLLIIIICAMSIGQCAPSRKEWKYLHCLLIIIICAMSIGQCAPSRKEWKYLHCLLIIIICEMSIGNMRMI